MSASRRQKRKSNPSNIDTPEKKSRSDSFEHKEIETKSSDLMAGPFSPKIQAAFDILHDADRTITPEDEKSIVDAGEECAIDVAWLIAYFKMAKGEIPALMRKVFTVNKNLEFLQEFCTAIQWLVSRQLLDDKLEQALCTAFIEKNGFNVMKCLSALIALKKENISNHENILAILQVTEDTALTQEETVKAQEETVKAFVKLDKNEILNDKTRQMIISFKHKPLLAAKALCTLKKSEFLTDANYDTLNDILEDEFNDDNIISATHAYCELYENGVPVGPYTLIALTDIDSHSVLVCFMDAIKLLHVKGIVADYEILEILLTGDEEGKYSEDACMAFFMASKDQQEFLNAHKNRERLEEMIARLESPIENQITLQHIRKTECEIRETPEVTNRPFPNVIITLISKFFVPAPIVIVDEQENKQEADSTLNSKATSP